MFLLRSRACSKLDVPLLLAFLLISAPPKAAEPVTVVVENKSTRTTCAEEDNVTYLFRADNGMRRFKVASTLPHYMNSVVRDIKEPDFANCPATPPPVTGDPPPDTILYQDKEIMLKGQYDRRFWRPHKASVRVGEGDWRFLDLIRLIKKTPAGPVEILVLYPQDGYWRLKGLPPRRFFETVFGSSFLLGPIEASETRPYVDYERISFDRKTLAFTVEPRRGGKMLVQLTGLGDEGTAEVTVTFDPPLPKGKIFSSIRSMYVSPGNDDTEHVTARSAPGAEPVRTPVLAFTSREVHDITFGRTELSRHNASAPDLRFFDFLN